MLEADGDLLTTEDLRRLAEAQVDVVRRVIELQVRGRRILPGNTEDGNVSAPRHHAPRTRHDVTVEHALRFRTYMLREQKYRISQKKKIVKAVDGYWSGIASVEERRRKEEERRIRTGAREIAKLVKSKWKLAVKVSCHVGFLACSLIATSIQVIHMRKQAEAKVEQERLGREQLKKILERSENMLKNRKKEKGKPRREDSETSMGKSNSHYVRIILDAFPASQLSLRNNSRPNLPYMSFTPVKLQTILMLTTQTMRRLQRWTSKRRKPPRHTKKAERRTTDLVQKSRRPC